VVGKELEIRRWLSRSHLYSSAFIVNVERDHRADQRRSVLHGAGWEHGWGSARSAPLSWPHSGSRRKKILKHYFQGAEIRRAIDDHAGQIPNLKFQYPKKPATFRFRSLKLEAGTWNCYLADLLEFELEFGILRHMRHSDKKTLQDSVYSRCRLGYAASPADTQQRAKPLLPLAAGRLSITYAMDHLLGVGVDRFIVNRIIALKATQRNSPTDCGEAHRSCSRTTRLLENRGGLKNIEDCCWRIGHRLLQRAMC